MTVGNQTVYEGASIPTRFVVWTGSDTTLNAGYIVCWKSDSGDTQAQSRKQVEKPTWDNLEQPAGVVANNYTGLASGDLIEIVEFCGTPLPNVEFYTDEDFAIDDIVGVKPDSFAACNGARFGGYVLGRALEAITSAGLVECRFGLLGRPADFPSEVAFGILKPDNFTTDLFTGTIVDGGSDAASVFGTFGTGVITTTTNDAANDNNNYQFNGLSHTFSAGRPCTVWAKNIAITDVAETNFIFGFMAYGSTDAYGANSNTGPNDFAGIRHDNDGNLDYRVSADNSNKSEADSTVDIANTEAFDAVIDWDGNSVRIWIRDTTDTVPVLRATVSTAAHIPNATNMTWGFQVETATTAAKTATFRSIQWGAVL